MSFWSPDMAISQHRGDRIFLDPINRFALSRMTSYLYTPITGNNKIAGNLISIAKDKKMFANQNR